MSPARVINGQQVAQVASILADRTSKAAGVRRQTMSSSQCSSVTDIDLRGYCETPDDRNLMPRHACQSRNRGQLPCSARHEVETHPSYNTRQHIEREGALARVKVRGMQPRSSKQNAWIERRGCTSCIHEPAVQHSEEGNNNAGRTSIVAGASNPSEIRGREEDQNSSSLIEHQYDDSCNPHVYSSKTLGT